MALWAIARRAKRPGGYQPKRGLATAVARTTIEVAGLRPSKLPMGFIDRLKRLRESGGVWIWQKNTHAVARHAYFALGSASGAQAAAPA